MATLTASAATSGAAVRAYPSGKTWSMAFRYTASSTLSNGDVILMGKVGHGTTILDGYVVQTDGDTGQLSAGIATVDGLALSQSCSAGNLIRFTNGLPYTVSMSDAATIRYDYVRLALDSDFTVSAKFAVVLHCQQTNAF